MNGGNCIFIEDKWPWILVALNILRNVVLLIVAVLFHVPRTDYWDYLLTLQIPAQKQGIAYGNDLLQGGNLPTAVLMTRGIVEALRGMVQPKAKHLYLDNMWKKLGTDINALYYAENVVIEHMHPLAGKSKMDDNYARVNSEQFYEHDRQVFEDFINSQSYADLVAKLS